MAKSKIVKANERIAESLTEGFQKMCDGVTDGFAKISDGVVGAYRKIEDGFVDRYLTQDNEIIEEAKERLAAKEAARREEAKAQLEACHISTDAIAENSLRRAKERSQH